MCQIPSSSSDSSDDDVKDDTYIPSPRAHPHGKGKGLASANSSGSVEIQEEEEEGEHEILDVEEISPPNYIHMGTPTFTQPQNPGLRAKVNYKGKTEAVREERKENPRLKQREATAYRFHTFFQQDFYESMILIKLKPVAISQWVDWRYMERKNDTFFDQVVAACKAKHLRDVMAF
jgi:hypothetical protein